MNFSAITDPSAVAAIEGRISNVDTVMPAILFGLGMIDPRVNAVWTTLQTLATFVLVGLTCRLLTTPARVADLERRRAGRSGVTRF